MSTRESRAAARAEWPVRKTDLANSDGLSALEVDGQAAWDAVMELSLAAWSLVGLPDLPKDRRQWPARKFGPGEHVPDSHGL